MTSKFAVFRTAWRLFRRRAGNTRPSPRPAATENPNFELPAWSFRSAAVTRHDLEPRKPCRPQAQRSEG